jgi:hypothetical protein
VSGLRKPRCEVLRLVGKEPYCFKKNRLFCYLYLDYIDTGYKPLESDGLLSYTYRNIS